MAYFPNGTAGFVLDAQCEQCPFGEKSCPIALVQLMYNYDQCDNPTLAAAMDMLIDEKGICQMKPLIDELKAE